MLQRTIHLPLGTEKAAPLQSHSRPGCLQPRSASREPGSGERGTRMSEYSFLEIGAAESDALASSVMAARDLEQMQREIAPPIASRPPLGRSFHQCLEPWTPRPISVLSSNEVGGELPECSDF